MVALLSIHLLPFPELRRSQDRSPYPGNSWDRKHRPAGCSVNATRRKASFRERTKAGRVESRTLGLHMRDQAFFFRNASRWKLLRVSRIQDRIRAPRATTSFGCASVIRACVNRRQYVTTLRCILVMDFRHLLPCTLTLSAYNFARSTHPRVARARARRS
jgi:hypothetical protein